MERIIIGCTLAFLVTLLIIPAIILIAKKKKLYDEPDEKRKLHKQPIPSLGGLAMFIGFIMSILLTLNFSKEAPEFQFYVASFLLIFFLGIKDDIMIISPTKKFVGQLITAAILVTKGNLLISNMGGLFGLHEIPVVFSYALTTFALVVIINAFNLIDGVDGLAGGIGGVSALVFGIFFTINGNLPYAILAFSFVGCVTAFLYYNFYPAKLFMGDTGSLMVGLVNSILVIKFIQTGHTYANYPVAAAPAVGFGILLLPLMDTLRVFTLRIIHGRSPFSPDRTHIHHLLLNRGFDHKTISVACISATALIAITAFVLQNIGTAYLFAALMALFFTSIYFLSIRKARVKFRVIKNEDKVEPEEQEQEVRLVSLFKKEQAPAMVEEE